MLDSINCCKLLQRNLSLGVPSPRPAALLVTVCCCCCRRRPRGGGGMAVATPNCLCAQLCGRCACDCLCSWWAVCLAKAQTNLQALAKVHELMARQRILDL